MARKQKEPFTFESNIDKVVAKIEEKPKRAMAIIGQNLVKEIKATSMKSQMNRRYKFMTKYPNGIQWAWGWDAANHRKDKASIVLGFKISIPGMIGKIMTGQEPDPIKPVVAKNANLIKEMVGKALDEIREE